MFDEIDEGFRRPLSAIRETSTLSAQHETKKNRKSVIFGEEKMTETEIQKKSKQG